jgi:hypothetical protein
MSRRNNKCNGVMRKVSLKHERGRKVGDGSERSDTRKGHCGYRVCFLRKDSTTDLQMIRNVAMVMVS